MKKLQSIIQNYITNHQKHKKYLAGVLALSVLVSFGVSAGLIMPAVSMTNNEENIEYNNEIQTLSLDADGANGRSGGKTASTTTRTPGESNDPKPAKGSIVGTDKDGLPTTYYYFKNAVNERPAGAKEIKNNYIVETSIKIGGENGTVYTNADNGNPNVTLEGNNNGSVAAEFSIKYNIGNESITTENPCIYYQLPDGITVDNTYFGSNRAVTGTKGAYASRVIGYFSISTDGLIVIQFNDNFINDELSSNGSTYEGTLHFNGNINRDNTADGDQVITVGGLTLKIPFEDEQFGLSKTHTAINNDNGEVNWTVEVTNTYNVNLNGWNFQDDHFPNNPQENVTIKVDGHPVEYSSIGTWTGNYFTFNDAVTSESITFEYKTTPGAGYDGSANVTVNNKAYLSQDTTFDDNDIKANSSVTYQKFDISKSGTPDYSVNDKEKIDWTINVTNRYGLSLKGFSVEDSAFNGASNIVVKQKDSDTVYFSSDDYEISDGKITFKNDITCPVEIKYSTDSIPEADWKKEGEGTDEVSVKATYNNTATLFKGNTEVKPAQTGADYEKKYNFIKRYSESIFNKKTSTPEMVWEISVANANNIGSNALKGIKIQDDAFKTATCIKITNRDNPAQEFIEDTHYTVDKENGIIEFTDPQYYKLKITYNVPVSKNENGEYEFGVDKSNTATLQGPKNKNFDKTATGKYISPYTLSKTGSYDRIENEIIWTVKACSNNQGDKKQTLEHYELTDDAFTNLNLSNINITSAKSGYDDCNWTLSEDGNSYVIKVNHWDINQREVVATITKNGNKIIIKDEKPYSSTMTDESQVLGIHSIEFTYKTSVADADKVIKTGSDGKEHQYINNGIGDSAGNTTSTNVEVTERHEFTKNLKGESSELVLINSSNTTGDAPRKEILNWQASITEDGGFTASNGDSKVMVDVMSVTGDNNADHYFEIGKNTITLQGGSYSADTALETGDYSIKYYDKNNNEIIEGKAATFDILFKSSIDTKKYRFISVEYSTTADYVSVTEPVGENDKVISFKNEATFTGNPNTPTVNYEITLRDNDYIPEINMNIKKVWSDNNNKDNKRPSNIKYIIARRLKDTNTWEYKTDETNADGDIWTSDREDERIHVYTLSGLGNTWNTSLNLPKENSEHVMYYYKAIETTDSDDYSVSYSSEDGINGGDFTITNTKLQSFTKSAFVVEEIDNVEKLKEVDSLTTNDLDRITIGDKEYYLIGWKVDFGSAISNRVILRDSVQSGIFIKKYIKDDKKTSWGDPIWYPAVFNGELYGLRWRDSYSEQDLANISTSDDYTIENNTELICAIKVNTSYVCYYTGVPVNIVNDAIESEGSYTVKNSASLDGGKPKEATVTISGSGGGDNEDNSLLDKNATSFDYRGNLEYAIIVNPEGKTISDTGRFEITDLFNLNGFDKSVENAKKLSVELDSVKIFEKDGNGEYRVQLNSSEYSYRDEYNPTTTTEKPLDLKVSLGAKYSSMTIQNKVDNYSLSEMHIKLKLKLTGAAGRKVKLGGKDITFNSDGEAIFEWEGVTGANNYVEFQKEYEAWYSPEIESAEVLSATYEEVVVDATAKVVFNVPDGKPLRILYSFKVLDENGNNVYAEANTYQGKEIAATNEISLDTGNASANDTTGKKTFTVNQADATGGTVGKPQIIKFNINNSGELLEADFIIAKYDTSTNSWQFANAEDTTSSGEYYKALNFGPLDNANTIRTENGSCKLELSRNILYAAIEVGVPEGYEGSNTSFTIEDTTYSSLDSMMRAYLSATNENKAKFESSSYGNLIKNFITYFTYDSSVEYTGKGIASDGTILNVNKINPSGAVRVSNNELIDISAEKKWESGVNGTAKAKLFWSYKSSGEDAKEVTRTDFPLLDSNFTAEKELTNNKATWVNLPSGKDKKIVYYFIKETEYTVDNITYTLRSDGTYKSTDDSIGQYKPIYSGNALNNDGTVKILNSSGLTLVKSWQDANGDELLESKIPNNVGDIKVEFVAKGTGVADIKEELILNSTNGWKINIAEELRRINSTKYGNIYFSKYTSFKVTEKLTDEQKRDSLYNWNCGNITGIGSIKDGVGEIKVINKNNTPTNVNVSVEKVWGDGNTDHTNDTVKVQLYQSKENLNIESFNKSTSIPESFVAYGTEVTLSSGNWTHKWPDLPYEDENNENNSRYYYYVLETSCTKGDYTVSYKNKGNTSSPKYEITNSPPSRFVVKKEWKDDSGNAIDSGTNSINAELYRRRIEQQTSGSYPNNFKVGIYGDSIAADNYGLNDAAGIKQYLISSLGSNGNVESLGGYTGAEINGLFQSVNAWNLNANNAGGFDSVNGIDAVVILIGTTETTYSTSEDELRALINEIYSTSKNLNLKIFLGAIPKIGYGADFGNYYETPPASQDEIDTLVSNYNNMVKSVVQEFANNGKAIYYVEDTNNIELTDLQGDHIHPESGGHKKIQAAYGVSTGTANFEPINKLPDDFYKADGTVSDSYKKVTDFEITKDGNWECTIPNDYLEEGYVYYVREIGVPNGWTESYLNNGQQSEQSNAIVIRNTKTVKKTNIKVQKNWIDGNATDRENITLKLKRKTDSTDWIDVTDVTQPTPTKNNNIWTYEYKDLPADNGNNDKYYYKIEEIVPAGYVVEYTDNGEATFNPDGTEGTISLTNKKAIKLTINKDWADGEPHTGDYIDVKIHRSTTQKGDSSLPLLMAISGNHTMQTGSTQTLTVNRTVTIEYTSSKENVATVGKTSGLVTAIAEGWTFITAKCGSETATFRIDVTDGEVTTTTTTISTAANTTTTTASATTTTTLPSGNYGTELTSKHYESNLKAEISGLKKGDRLVVTLLGTPNTSVNGAFGYSVNNWTKSQWGSKNIGYDGKLVIEYTVPDDYNGEYFEFQVWNCDSTTVTKLYYKVESSTSGNTPTGDYGTSLTLEVVKTENGGHIKRADISGLKTGDKLVVTLLGTQDTNVNGCFGYSYPTGKTWEWVPTYWSGNIGSDGKCIVEYPTVPDNFPKGASLQFQIWDNCDKVNDVYYKVETGNTGTGDSGNTDPENPGGNTGNSNTVRVSTTKTEFSCDSSKKLLNVTGSNVTVNGSTGTFNINVNDYASKVIVTYLGGSHEFDLTLSYDGIATQIDENGIALCSMLDEYICLASEDSTVVCGKLSEFDTNGVATLRMACNSATVNGQTWTEFYNLPAYDKDGNRYYYWAEEEKVSGYIVSYSFEGSGDSYFIDASKISQGTITITNTKEESENVTMPSTGGKGADWYYIIGAGLMSGAVVMLVRRRRRSA